MTAALKSDPTLRGAVDTARLAILGLTVAMPLPSTWTGVAVDPAPAAPAATATNAVTSGAGAALVFLAHAEILREGDGIAGDEKRVAIAALVMLAHRDQPFLQ